MSLTKSTTRTNTLTTSFRFYPSYMVSTVANPNILLLFKRFAHHREG